MSQEQRASFNHFTSQFWSGILSWPCIAHETSRPFFSFCLFLLIPFVLLSCGNDAKYEVIDSELRVSSPTSNYIHWFDKETVLFSGWTDNRLKKRNKDGSTDLTAWNYKTNAAITVLANSKMLCAEGETVFFYRAGDVRTLFKGILVRENLDVQVKNIEMLKENTIILKNKLHCSHVVKKKIDISLVANLKAFNMELKRVWPAGTSLAVKRRGHNPTPIPTIFSDKKPYGLPLHIGKVSSQVMYISYLNKYLLRSGKKSDKGNQNHPYRPLRRYWLLSEDSTYEEIPLPDGWDQAQHLFPSVKGPVITYLDMRKENPKSSDNGAFLIVGGQREDAVKLLRGDLNATTMSADGCRLATAHFYKIIPFASNNPTLKVIDMCIE